jgi:hypothetical protein
MTEKMVPQAIDELARDRRVLDRDLPCRQNARGEPGRYEMGGLG